MPRAETDRHAVRQRDDAALRGRRLPCPPDMNARVEAMLMMASCPAHHAYAACAQRNVPRRLMAITSKFGWFENEGLRRIPLLTSTPTAELRNGCVDPAVNLLFIERRCVQWRFGAAFQHLGENFEAGFFILVAIDRIARVSEANAATRPMPWPAPVIAATFIRLLLVLTSMPGLHPCNWNVLAAGEFRGHDGDGALIDFARGSSRWDARR